MEFFDEIVDYDVNLLNQHLAEIVQFCLQVRFFKASPDTLRTIILFRNTT